MKTDILDRIIAAKRDRLRDAKIALNETAIQIMARDLRDGRERSRLTQALKDRNGSGIIAEFKRASPSKGLINDTVDPADAAAAYRDGGAAAISVLTEEDFFRGSLNDLRKARAAVDLPILRKDFIVEAYQIYEAALAGADAILLIVAALDTNDLAGLRSIAVDLGLDVLVEVHDLDELAVAHSIGADLIGVNNRDLRTFEVSLDTSRRLIDDKRGALFVSESGLSTAAELAELRSLGYDGFLIGETFMRGGLELLKEGSR